MIAAIWAQDDQGLIGKGSQMPWHLPNDLKFFKQMTENNTIVMGRTTFEGMGSNALPNRKTIVLTNDKKFTAQNVTIMHSVEEVLSYAQEFPGMTFIAGGSVVYKNFLPYCDVLYRTFIDHSFEGDTYFPVVDWNKWNLINVSEGDQDEKNQFPYKFETYQKNLQSK